MAELAELVSLNRKRQDDAQRLLRAYLAAHPALAEHRPRSLEACAKALLKARFCQMVGPIELRFDYPSWLGDLYNGCDWCENGSSRKDFPYVRLEAKRLIRAF